MSVERWLRHTVDDLTVRGGVGSALPLLSGILVLALIAAGAVGWLAASRSFGEVDLTEVPPLSTSTAGESDSVDPTPTVRVHVVGSVHAPGVYSLEEGAIVADAIERAGGPIEDAAFDAINLAEMVWDGQQVRVPSAADIESGFGALIPGSAGSAMQPASGPVNINSADSTLLETLPGIGAATAAKIIDDRERNGRFASLDDLTRVSGIGEKKVEALRDLAVAR